MRKKGRYVRNCSMRLVIVSVQMSRVAKSTQRTEEKKRMNELKCPLLSEESFGKRFEYSDHTKSMKLISSLNISLLKIRT